MEDYKVMASFSEDEMEGYITIVPLSSSRTPIVDVERFISLIKGEGIVFGIDEERVMEAIRKYNSGEDVKEFLVAKGKPPEEGQDGRIEFKIDMKSGPKIDEKGRINYKELDKIKNVEKGQLLAIKWKPVSGKRGTTVTGLGLEPKRAQDVLLFAGKNVYTEEKEDSIYYYAKENGYVVYQKDRLMVKPLLTIDGDVDYSIGNIRYNGDVRVLGDVLPDFLVEAKGSVLIYGTAMACTIRAGKNVVIRGGFAGKESGKIFAEGDVDISYVERGYIEAKGDVYVRTGILDSEIIAYGKVYSEIKGSKILESKIKAGNGVDAFVVGSPYTKNIEITVGVDIEKEKELEKMNEEFEKIVEEFSQLKKKYGEDNLEKKNKNIFISRISAEQIEKDFERYDELKKEIPKKYEELKQFKETVYSGNAVVKVKNIVYPKTKIRIGEIEFIVKKELYNVIFYLSKDEGEIKWTTDIK